MVLFNHATREMTAKIVYYGPGLCGKTTNLLVIFDKLDPKSKGKMLSLATKTDRTLFFDLLPVDIGKVGNFNLKIQLYTVPGQVFYNETRKLVLKGADSVVFVADSQPTMIESNRESFANLIENLEQNQLDPNDIPIVVQYNKRDLPGVIPVEEMQEALGFEGYPYMEAAAINGEGVMETFKLVTKITAKHLIAKLGGKSSFPDLKESKRATKRVEVKEPVQSGAVAALSSEPPAAEPPTNPFADSVPFPETPIDQGYEKMEEVSLEQLLEGRDRPATISGNVPIPVTVVDDGEEVEELDAADILTDLPPAVAAAPIEEELPPTEAESISFAAAGGEELPVVSIDEPLPPIAHLSGDDGHASALEREVRSLREENERLRQQYEALRSAVARGVGELSKLIEP